MKFGEDVARFAIEVDKDNEQKMRGTAVSLFSEIAKMSPVDTGRFRGNWFVTGLKSSGKTTNKSNYDQTPKKSYDPTYIYNDVMAIRDWSVFHLTNNLPYSHVLEFGGYPNPAATGTKTENGFSEQAPDGMVRVTIARHKI